MVPQLEISVELLAVGSKVRSTFGQKIGHEYNTELSETRNKISQNSDSSLNWNLFRVEKLEMPWKTNWIVTDINGFMHRKHKRYYELPGGSKFEDLKPLYEN